MLECFHPSEKLTEPHVFCAYLGTDGLSERHDDEFAGSLYEDVKETEKLGRLSGLYSRFRPIPREEEGDSGYNGRRFFPTGPGTMVGVVGADSTSTRPEGPEEVVSAEKPRFVKRTIHLESAEDFSQLCTVVNLVRVIPNSNLLLSAVTVEDGIIRIWRDWLEEQAQLERVDAAQRRAAETVSREGHTIPSDAGAGSRPLANGRRRRLEEGDSGILWVDGARNVGLKFRVRQKRWRREETMPILMHRDEEPAVSYEVDIEGLSLPSRYPSTSEDSLLNEWFCRTAHPHDPAAVDRGGVDPGAAELLAGGRLWRLSAEGGDVDFAPFRLYIYSHLNWVGCMNCFCYPSMMNTG